MLNIFEGAPVDVLARLVAAFLFGVVIAGIYRWTRGREASRSFAMTLLLLSVLIAMVTQVIGDNVARAFSLVGALSIVRFRTVVRDTQDTAYVILAVIVGMAVGAWNLWVATMGIGVVGLAELIFAMRGRINGRAEAEYELKVRTAADVDLDGMVTEALGGQLVQRELCSMGMVKQGESVEARYLVVPKKGASIAEMLREVTGRAGVQTVQFTRRGMETD